MNKIRIAAAFTALVIAAGASAGTPSALAKKDDKGEKSVQANQKGKPASVQEKKADKSSKRTTSSSAIPELRTSWEIADLSFPEAVSALNTAAGLVFYESEGSLRAAYASTGKLKWSYKGTAFPLAEAKHAVFLVDGDGKLIRVDAKKGKAVWNVKKAVENPEEAYARLVQGTLYVSDPSVGIKAFNPANGKRKWTSAGEAPGFVNTIDRYGDVLVANVQDGQGAQSLIGLDAENGDRLWQLDGSYDVLMKKDDKLLLRDKSGSMPLFNDNAETDDPEVDKEDALSQSEDVPSIEVEPEPENANTEDGAYKVELVYADPQSGELSRAGRYGPLDSAEFDSAKSSTFLSGGYVYTADETDEGTILTGFRLNADDGKNSLIDYADKGSLLSIPDRKTAFFQSGTSLSAVKLGGGSFISFGDLGSKVVFGPITSGQSVYAGLENGEVHIFDAKTGESRGKWSAADAKIKSIDAAGTSVIIRTEDKLIGLSVSARSK